MKFPSEPIGALRVRRILLASLLVAGVFGVAAWFSGNALTHAADRENNDANAVLVHRGDTIVIPEKSTLRQHLKVASVSASRPTHATSFPGIVEAEPSRTVAILPPATGRIVAVRVRLGDVVKANQPLVILSSADAAQAEADLQKARDSLSLATRALARAEGVNSAGANAQKDIEQFESAKIQAQAEMTRAAARIAALGARAGEPGGASTLTVSSPTAGVVTALSVASGAFVNDPTVPMLTISNLDSVWVTANIPEDDAANVQKGMAVEVRLRSAPGEALAGKIAFVTPILDPDTRRARARIEFANPAGRLMPNMFATVTVALPVTSQISVPPSALLMNNDSVTVFVETAPWVFVRRTVETGVEDADAVRIVKGLNANERVVVAGGILLND